MNFIERVLWMTVIFLFAFAVGLFIYMLCLRPVPVSSNNESNTTVTHRTVEMPDEWWILQRGEYREVWVVVINGEPIEVTEKEWNGY